MSPVNMFSNAPAPTKTVVLDTSVLVADPDAVHQFEGCALKIPLTAIEELDGLKTRPDGVARPLERRCVPWRPYGSPPGAPWSTRSSWSTVARWPS
jgi:hypothetical protein